MHQRPPSRTHARLLTLAPHPAAVPGVRRRACQALREWDLEAFSDTVELLVSELVTNAVRASADAGPYSGRPGQPAEIALTLWRSAASVGIEVWDARPDPAAPQQPDSETESGRGLIIVEAMASDWGQHAQDGGKVVWCELSLLPAAVPGGVLDNAGPVAVGAGPARA